jgi:hypothetical protein
MIFPWGHKAREHQHFHVFQNENVDFRGNLNELQQYYDLLIVNTPQY